MFLSEKQNKNNGQAKAVIQPVAGGRNEVYLEIHPDAARKRGIKTHDRVKISNDLGTIYARAHVYPAARPDTVVLPFGFGHFAHGRWARNRETGNVNELVPNVSEAVSN